jgi:lipoyl(octanoyl) transferase
MNKNTLIVSDLGCQDYQSSLLAMQTFTNQRTPSTPDEIWLVEHPSVFTQGRVGKPEHLLETTSIPVLESDRGGQITYHGPGQLVVYTLVDLKRRGIHIRNMVTALETITITTLADYNIDAYADKKAPGIYINKEKIASLGLRVKHHRCFHGIAINVTMDLSPFKLINPCGHQGLRMTQCVDHNPNITITMIKEKIITHFINHFGYTCVTYT